MTDVFDTDQGDQSTSALEELVGDGKKFADNEALAKGKQESDNFIEQLKNEKQEALDALEAAKKDVGEGKTVADLLEAVRAAQEPNDKGNLPLSDEDFQEKVRSIVQGEKADTTRTANREKGNSLVLQKVDGNVEAAKTFVAERAQALGVTPAKLRELSEDSPELFAKAMELDTSTAPKGTAQLPNVNTNNLQPVVVEEVDGHKTKAHYDRLKKDMGVRKYLDDHKLQNELMADAIALGERFNN
jgi:hypothetical protein